MRLSLTRIFLFLSLFSSLPLWADGHGISDIKIGGHLDFHYAKSSLNPPFSESGGMIPGTDYTSYNDSFNLGMAQISFSKETENFGFKMVLGGGSIAEAAIGDHEQSSSFLREAYITYKAPMGILVDAGKFNGLVGFEGIPVSDNNNYSLTFATQLTPFWHTGLRASYPTEKVTGTLYIVNGIDRTHDNNSNKGLGLSLALSPNEIINASFNLLSTGEKDESAITTQQTFTNYNISYKIQEELILSVSYLSQENRTDSLSTLVASSIAGFIKWDFLQDWSFSPRYEIFSNKDKLYEITSADIPFTINSITATLENRINENLKGKFEIRQDSADQKIYQKNKSDDFNEDTNITYVFGILADF